MKQHPWQQYVKEKSDEQRLSDLKDAVAARYAALRPWNTQVRREDLQWLLDKVEKSDDSQR